MDMFNRRIFFGSAAVGAVAPMTVLASACSSTADPSQLRLEDGGDSIECVQNPYKFGAVGDGRHDDTSAIMMAYETAIKAGGGRVEFGPGRFYIPGNLEINEPGVSFTGLGDSIIGGGEFRIGPADYGEPQNGVDFSGDRVANLVFDRGDEYGEMSRCLVLRNVRGLDVSSNFFSAAGKGIAVEAADGNDKFHTTAMLRIAGNRFSRLTVGIFGDTVEWDRLSDWQIADNYFNYCSDTSVWISSTDDETVGGIDGLDFSANTIFSMGYTEASDPLFSKKRYNLRLGKTNWLRIVNNNFFEAGLSAVLLDIPQNFTFTANHIAWPGQRELADGLEIRGGKPIGVVSGNTFARWTRAAVGLYETEDNTQIEIGQNAWSWTPTPPSWTGPSSLPGYRVFAASRPGARSPIVRDFQVTGTLDSLGESAYSQARDVKSPSGGVSGGSRRNIAIASPVTVFRVTSIVGDPDFGGLLLITAANASENSLIATYLLFVVSAGELCKVVESGGFTEGEDSRYPSFSWSIKAGELQANPVGSTNGLFNFDAIGLGAVSPS